MSLFEKPVAKPLADRMRPLSLDEYLGQGSGSRAAGQDEAKKATDSYCADAFG